MLLENNVKKVQALVVHGIAAVVLTQPFMIKIENWSTQQMLLSKKQKY